MSTKRFDDQLAKIEDLIDEYNDGLLLQDELASSLLNAAATLLDIANEGPEAEADDSHGVIVLDLP